LNALGIRRLLRAGWSLSGAAPDARRSGDAACAYELPNTAPVTRGAILATPACVFRGRPAVSPMALAPENPRWRVL
jgi:hypothetical protein